MAILMRGKSRLESIFGIHGDDENDMSAGFAYLLAKSNTLLAQVIEDLTPGLFFNSENVEVGVQISRKGEGITDIELFLPGQAFIVFEVKKGMNLPSLSQLEQYTLRCKSSGCKKSQLIVLTAVRQKPAIIGLGVQQVNGVPVTARSWEWVREMLTQAIKQEGHSRVQWLLKEYYSYLEDFMGHDRIFSNLVYVVSLGQGKADGWDTSWIDIVEKYGKYFYPVSGWPPPPNYLGFRYDGRLQAIHHIDDFDVVEDVREHFPGSESGEDWGPHYLFRLGPRIQPPHEVRNGPRVLRANRVWCMLDTLLTCETISDALTETEKRRGSEAV